MSSIVRLFFAYHNLTGGGSRYYNAWHCETYAPFLPDVILRGAGGAPLPPRYLVGRGNSADGRGRSNGPRQGSVSRPLVRQAAAAGRDLPGMGRARWFPLAVGRSAVRATGLLDCLALRARPVGKPGSDVGGGLAGILPGLRYSIGSHPASRRPADAGAASCRSVASVAGPSLLERQ